MAFRYTLNKPRMRCIVSDGQDKAKRLLLLTDTVSDTGKSCLICSIKQCSRAAPLLQLLNLPTDQLPQALKDCIMQDKIPIVEYTLHVGYDQMSADEVIRVGADHHCLTACHSQAGAVCCLDAAFNKC